MRQLRHGARRGRDSGAASIGADEDRVPCLAACVTWQGGCDAEGAAALVKPERAAA
jgi:hypothetical protein